MDDAEELRRKLIDEVYAMATAGTPEAMLELGDIEDADPDELVAIARRFGLR
jgi:hypothetical protein